MKRSLFLALAAGLIASVAITAPAKAASTVDTKAVFILSPSTDTTSEVDITYQDGAQNPLSSIDLTKLVIVHDGGLGLTPASFSTFGTSTVVIKFAAANKTTGAIGPPVVPGIEFQFASGNAPGDVDLRRMDVITGPGTSITQGVSVTSFNVPEPASLALLGIGMSGLVALRRFLPKRSAA
jgi:hypothetical protein